MFRRDDPTDCGNGGGDSTTFGLRIASVFIILIGSMFGASFPVLARRSKWLSPRVPQGVFDFAKYFGSGVIVSRPKLRNIYFDGYTNVGHLTDCYRLHSSTKPGS